MSTLEDLIATQEQISKAIEQLYTNFKKDGSERKTPDYIRRRLDTLDQYWNEFHSNHVKLSSCEDKSHGYFIKNIYDQVHTTYDLVYEAIQSCVPQAVERPRTPIIKPPSFVPPSAPTHSQATCSKTEDMIRKQGSNFKAFMRTVKSIKLELISEKWEFEDLLRTLQARWSAIDSLHWELDSELNGSNKEYEQQFSEYEECYHNIKKSINRKMWSVSFRETSTPRMEIPIFAGNYSQWTSFKDLFTESIHNNPSISSAQKLQFLKGKLKGEPERLIQHLQISSDNYNVCWEILLNRYNNKKLIFTSHVNTLLGIPIMQQQSSNHIKRIHDPDIEKMFRQIWVNSDHQKLQRIIWRENQTRPLQEYQLTTVTYGTKSAPFLAMMTLKQLARDERANYQDSQAPSALEESFYMDDFLHGSHSLSEAKMLQKDIIDLLKKGGFNLRKWKANVPELLDDVPRDQDYQENFDFKQVESTKTLGLKWNPIQDNFLFQSNIPTSTDKPTKRTLLSDISKLFDPLGWMVPLTTKLKILFQDVWKADLEWDEPVPIDIYKEWNRIKEDISVINELHVPRWLNTTVKETIELHGFSDASTKAYACVIYCKTFKENGPSVVLVAGKTKLVPLNKETSLPRLELSGALLLSKLMAKIKSCLHNYEIKTFGWVDSMVVLAWLNGDAEKWRPFVANRVREITQKMPSECWRYIKSKENPADCASRGLTAGELKEHSLWWQGPEWLPEFKPKQEEKKNYTTNQEMRKVKQVNTAQVSGEDIIKELLKKYSSLSKVIRVLSWVLRFTEKNKKQDYLTTKELKRARDLIIRHIQQEEFSEEIQNMRSGKPVSNKSKLSALNPVLDQDDILRVGGRLKNANIDPEMKHPIIIPKQTRLTDLIIDHSHKLTFHGGPKVTSAFTRQKYWLLGGIRTIKKRLRLCVKCKKHSPNKHHQIMGDLPSCRINPSRPFYHTGVDYTGHVFIKANKGRGIKTLKGYVAVFVCMATKAVHLELVSDLTSSALLAALRRMAARRGTPGHMYSDQGTNFIGANKILQQELREIQQAFNQELMTEIAEMEINWHFQAPAWPSAGGLWERSVQSLKYHLRRVIGEQRLTFEEFSTLLAQLEACLNSRPLCTLTEDPEDINFLTPSHFLASGPNLTIYETEKDLRTRWHLVQKIYKDVWDRWSKEYLTQISSRSKWRKPQNNINIDDVVIIQDDNLPPGKWTLGRVVQLHPGADGHVRVVTLKTKNGHIKRPIIKLSILPTYNPSQDENQASPEPTAAAEKK